MVVLSCCQCSYLSSDVHVCMYVHGYGFPELSPVHE